MLVGLSAIVRYFISFLFNITTYAAIAISYKMPQFSFYYMVFRNVLILILLTASSITPFSKGHFLLSIKNSIQLKLFVHLGLTQENFY